MHFTLSAVGENLGAPVTTGVDGAVEDAILVAQDILEREPACQAVEIFANGRFLRDVARPMN
jgi:hypothetical protein